MSASTSVAARVLNSPELLHTILDFFYGGGVGADEYHDLPQTLRQKRGPLYVNRFWWSIAMKYMWRHCGERNGPVLSDFEALETQPDRAQAYANCIETLELDRSALIANFLGRQRDGHLHSIRHEDVLNGAAEYWPRLDFPRLKTIRVGRISEQDQGGNEIGPLRAIQYLQETVKVLEVDWSRTTEEFWAAVSVSASFLRNVGCSQSHLQLFHSALVLGYRQSALLIIIGPHQIA